jgi:hypothetical protein
MRALADVAAVLAGTLVVLATLASSVRTVMLPRGVAVRLPRRCSEGCGSSSSSGWGASLPRPWEGP